MRVPVKRGGAEIVPARYFIPVAALILFWMTQKYDLVDRSAIFLGLAVVPTAVYLYFKGLKPLTLFANGNISIPSHIEPTAILIKKSEIKAYTELPHETLVFLGASQEVLGVVRPANF